MIWPTLGIIIQIYVHIFETINTDTNRYFIMYAYILREWSFLPLSPIDSPPLGPITYEQSPHDVFVEESIFFSNSINNSSVIHLCNILIQYIL